MEVQELLNSLGGPAWLLSPGGTVAYANAPAQDLPAYPPVHPYDAPRLEAAWQRLEQTGTPFSLSLRLGRPERYRHFDCRLAQLGEYRLLLGQEARLLERLLEHLPLGVGLLNQELRFEGVNPAFSRLTPLRAEAHLGRSLGEVLGEAAGPLEQLCQATLRSLVSQEEELRFEAKGILRFWQVGAYPLQDADPPLRMALSVEDVSERRMAEEALHLSEERFRSLVEAGAQVVWVTDPGGGFAFAQPSWSRFTGQRWHQYRGWGWLQAIHPEHRERVAAQWRECLRERKPFESEYPLRRRDGEYRYTLARAVPLLAEEGTVREWVGLNTDITDRARAEEALRASEEQFRRTVEEAPIPLILQAEGGAVLQLSRAWTELTGYTLSDLPTLEDWLGRTYGPGAKALREGLRGLLEGGLGVVEAEFDLVTRGGDVRTWAMSATSPGKLRDGRRFVVGMAVDLTERKGAEAALRESEERYREISEAQKRFVNDAAHELRAPLTAIQGNLDLLVRFKDMTAEDREAALAEASREAARLGRLVGDLLALARGDAGHELKLVPLALEKVLLETFEAKRRLSREHRLELGRLDPVWVQGDSEQLKHLLLILLDNAVQYTPPGGTIHLELSSEGEQAVLRLRDTGVGIAPEDLQHVFERFYRVDEARTPGSDPGGTGLGLSIARWIVEQHGGTIHLESQLGRGTTVTVALPQSSTKVKRKL
jgi:PAS domain S-box-containing protein